MYRPRVQRRAHKHTQRHRPRDKEGRAAAGSSDMSFLTNIACIREELLGAPVDTPAVQIITTALPLKLCDRYSCTAVTTVTKPSVREGPLAAK